MKQESEGLEHEGSLGVVSWILLGLSSGIGALLLGVGLWNSPVEVLASGVVVAGGLAALVAMIDSKTTQGVAQACVVAALLSLVSGVWFVEDLRKGTLTHAGSILPEGALQKAFETEPAETALRACAALIHKESADRGMIRVFGHRPAVSSVCLVSDDVAHKERQHNLRRRMARLWNEELLVGKTARGCQLVDPLERTLAGSSSGVQRLLLIALTSGSEEIRTCTADALESRLTKLSKVGFVSALGPTDALGTESARKLFTAIISNQISSQPRVHFSKYGDLLNGWSLQLACRDDLVPYAEVRSAVGVFLGHSECGVFDVEESRAVWNGVCADLAKVSIRDAAEKACSLTNDWAVQEAFWHASLKLRAALRAYRQTDTTRAIYSADAVTARDAPYEARFGTQQMKRALDSSKVPPLVRQRIMDDLIRVQRYSRGLTRQELAVIRDVQDAEVRQELMESNMERAREFSGSEEIGVDALLEEHGVELDEDERKVLDSLSVESD